MNISVMDDAFLLHLSEPERPHFAALRTQLLTQYTMLARFDDDLALLKFCNDLRFGQETRPSDEMSHRLGSWSVLACRDACIAIWEVGHATHAARECLSRVATLSPFADHTALRRFDHIFAGRFKDYAALRHVAAHFAEMRESELALAINSLPEDPILVGKVPAYNTRQIHQRLAGGRIFSAVHEQRIVTLEMTDETRERLACTITDCRALYQGAVDRFLAR